jgi:ribose 5-phosphate isomerase B
MKMGKKIIIGSDHAGFRMKESLMEFLGKKQVECRDMGVYNDMSKSDYPETAYKVAKEVSRAKSKGILICGTGIGECIVANKVKGIRAANCTSEYMARMSREHNDSNILCLGGRITPDALAKRIANAWLETEFTGEPRHKKRISQIHEIEKKESL